MATVIEILVILGVIVSPFGGSNQKTSTPLITTIGVGLGLCIIIVVGYRVYVWRVKEKRVKDLIGMDPVDLQLTPTAYRPDAGDSDAEDSEQKRNHTLHPSYTGSTLSKVSTNLTNNNNNNSHAVDYDHHGDTIDKEVLPLPAAQSDQSNNSSSSQGGVNYDDDRLVLS